MGFNLVCSQLFLSELIWGPQGGEADLGTVIQSHVVFDKREKCFAYGVYQIQSFHFIAFEVPFYNDLWNKEFQNKQDMATD